MHPHHGLYHEESSTLPTIGIGVLGNRDGSPSFLLGMFDVPIEDGPNRNHKISIGIALLNNSL